MIDRHTGEVKEAQIFVAVMGASNYTYAEATWSQGLAAWSARRGANRRKPHPPRRNRLRPFGKNPLIPPMLGRYIGAPFF